MNKKKIIIVVAILVSIVLVGFGVGISLTSNSKKQSNSKNVKVKLTKHETKTMKYDNYDNGNFSMKIPKGWKVSVNPNSDNIHYTFMVENPKNSDYRIFFNMKFEGSFINEKEKYWYVSNYGAYDTSGIISKLPIIDPQTTEAFYKIFNQVGKINNTNGFMLPVMNDFTKKDSIGTNPTGGEIIRGNYNNSNNKKVDGVFTTTIKPVSLYYITMLNMYNTVFFTAPDGELTNWIEVLNYCVSTINFSDSFVNNYYNEEKKVMSTSAAISMMASETSGIIAQGWNSRQSTYDIISQKQSDATTGYERVYDKDTGEIYKATNGWFENYSNKGGERYEMIDDKMYNSPITGYIE